MALPESIVATPVTLPFKGAGEVLNYAVDFTEFLTEDAVLDHSVNVVNAELGRIDIVGAKVTFILSGGRNGTTAKATVTVNTSAGLRVEQLVNIPIRQR
jgi:hypothetical protein